MRRILFLSLAALIAAPALAGDPVGRDDLHHDDANTRERPRDRAVEREDLQQGARADEERKGDMDREAARYRYENGRYIVTDTQAGGAKVEVSHDEDAIRTTAGDRAREAGDDLRRTAREIVNGAARGVDRLEDRLDRAIDTSPEDQIEDIEDEERHRDPFPEED